MQHDMHRNSYDVRHYLCQKYKTNQSLVSKHHRDQSDLEVLFFEINNKKKKLREYLFFSENEFYSVLLFPSILLFTHFFK